MIIRVIAAIVGLLISTSIQAQTVKLDEGYMSSPADDFAFSVVQRIVAKLPSEERSTAQDVEIRVVAEGLNYGPRTGQDSTGQRVVILPFDFLRTMQEMAVAELLVADGYQSATYPEEWLAYWGLRRYSQGRYNGNPPLLALEYAWISDAERQKFFDDYGELSVLLYAAGLADIILHEIGHHVADALYDRNSVSSAQARAFETRADDWASQAFREFASQSTELKWLDTSNLAGRFMSLIFVREVEAAGKFGGIPSTRTHPETGARLLRALNMSDCEDFGNQEQMEMFCERIVEKAQGMVSSNRSPDYYRSLSQKGDIFATYKLAFMRGTVGDYAEACKLFYEAAKRGVDDRVHHYVGECYAEGILGKGQPHSDRFGSAIFHYCKAARVGFLDSKSAASAIALNTGYGASCSN